MKTACMMLTLFCFSVLAAGEFDTGCAELLKFSGYGLFRWDFYGMENANPGNGMRSYFNVNWDPKLNSHVSGRMQLDLNSNTSNSVRLAEIYLNLKLTGSISLMGGQFKVPFGYGWTRPGGSMYFADRAFSTITTDYRNYAVRDNGVCLVAGFDPVRVDLGYFNGVGANKTADNSRNGQFAARVAADAASWLSLGAAFTTIGQPEIEDSTGTIDSWSSSGMDFYAAARYPLGESAKLFFEGEYAILGRTGADVEGMEKNDGSCMSIGVAAEFGVGGGFVRNVRPAVRYDMVDPSTMIAEGADEPENNVNVLDFCVGLDLTDNRNTLMLGARNFSFENDNLDGYTDIYLNWRMNF